MRRRRSSVLFWPNENGEYEADVSDEPYENVEGGQEEVPTDGDDSQGTDHQQQETTSTQKCIDSEEDPESNDINYDCDDAAADAGADDDDSTSHNSVVDA